MALSSVLSLGDFKSLPAGQFAPGIWVVEYHDKTHLPENTYVALGKAVVEECTQKGDTFFRFQPRPTESLGGTQTSDAYDQGIGLSLRGAWANRAGEGDPEHAAEVIYDQLSESLVRLGITRPLFEIDGPELSERKFAVVVLDTNALRDGAIRHLKEQFRNLQLWIIIPTISLMEIGERVAYMTNRAKGQWKPGELVKRCRLFCGGSFRPRPRVTRIIGYIR